MDSRPLPSAERDALLALWAVPGIGSVGLGGMRRWAAGPWADLLDTPTGDWVDGLPASDLVRARIPRRGVPPGGGRGDPRAGVARADGGAAPGRPGLSGAPGRSARCAARPLHAGYRGPAATPARAGGHAAPGAGLPPPRPGVRGGRCGRWRRRRVGGRRGRGPGPVTSGALDVGGETWAFLGSALDVVDPAQARLVPPSSTAAGRCSASCRRESGRARRRFPGETDSSLAHRMRSWCSGPAGTAVRCTPWPPPVSRGRPCSPVPGRPGRRRPGLQPAGGARTRTALHRAHDALRAVGLGPRRRPERWSRGRCRVCRPRAAQL